MNNDEKRIWAKGQLIGTCDHPLIREIYPETHWHWIRQTSKAQSNNDVNEVLILNGAPRQGVIA